MATLYFRNVGISWNNTSSWSITSSTGLSAGIIPTSSDIVIFDGSSATSCPVSTTPGVCLTLTTIGYGGTITLNVSLTVSGNITMGALTVMAGTAALICNASATLTSNGNTTINCPFTLSNVATGNTFTLADNWTLNALFTTSSSTGSLTLSINGFNLYCKTGFTINGGTVSTTTLTTGTTIINMIGTGTITAGAGTSSGGLGNSLTINTLGTIAMPGNFYYRTSTFKYIAGTLTGTSNFSVTGNCTLDMNNGALAYATPFTLNIASLLTVTITLVSDWYLSGFSNLGTPTINGFSMYMTGTFSSSTGPITGTTVFRFKSSVSGQTIGSSTNVGNDISFEAGSNTITIGNFIYAARAAGSSITYTSGTVNATGTLTINGPNTVTLNTSGINWNNITFSGSSFTITINSLLRVLGTLGFQNQNYTFAGTAGFTANTLTWTSTTVVTNTGIVLAPGITYTVTTALTLFSSTIATYLGLKSSTPSSVAYFNLNTGATQSVGNIQVTDINSSGGQTIWAWRPNTLSNTTNWNILTNASMQFSSTFVN